MVDLYKCVLDGVVDLGFLLSIYFEVMYGVLVVVFEIFVEMFVYWLFVELGKLD